MSTARKKTKARAAGPDDWVWILPDGRLCYYDSGIHGVGVRKFVRCKKLAGGAEGERQRMLSDRERGAKLKIGPATTWADGCRKWAEAHGQLDEAALRKVTSAINTWIVPVDREGFALTGRGIGEVKLLDTTLATKMKVLDELVAAGNGRSSLNGVSTSMNTIAAWLVSRDYLPPRPFGFKEDQEAAMRSLRKLLKPGNKPVGMEDGDGDRHILNEAVPTRDDVGVFGDAIRDHTAAMCASWKLGEIYGRYPNLCAGTGARGLEALGFTIDQFDLDAGDVHIDRQVDRYRRWEPGEPMPTRLPKGHKKRHAAIMSWCRADIEFLIAAAIERGDVYLFPQILATDGPQRTLGWWGDGWGRVLTACRQKSGWKWPAHFCRHHYASYLLEPLANDGYGQSLKMVSEWLGHSRPSITADIYWQPTDGRVGYVG